MSRTNRRNAARIWAYVIHLARARGFDGALIFTAGELAKEADVSIGMAKKYLDMAVAEGALSSWRMLSGRTVYTYRAES